MHLGASPCLVVPPLHPGRQCHTANPLPQAMPVPQIAPQWHPQAMTAFQAIPFSVTRANHLIIQPPQIGVNITTQKRSSPLPQTAMWRPHAQQLVWQPMHRHRRAESAINSGRCIHSSQHPQTIRASRAISVWDPCEFRSWRMPSPTSPRRRKPLHSQPVQPSPIHHP